jgi:pimeloyl-ACP methyl ester carboxylesterase
LIALSEFSCPVDDGVVLRGAQSRGGDGEPLVLLHGYSDSWRSYLPLMRELPPSMRLVALSLRGHGDSSKPTAAYGTEVMARDVARAMDHLGLSRAVVVGHSMGSLVAQRVAQDNAGRVSRLVLIGAFASLKGNPGAEALWRDAISTMTDPVPPAFAREFQSSCLARPVPDEFLSEVVAESLKLPAHVWRSALEAVMNEDRSNLLGRIAAPTTIIWGDRDAFCGKAEQERLARSIPDARLVVYEGTGHAPHWEEPARAAADLVATISVTAASRTAA